MGNKVLERLAEKRDRTNELIDEVLAAAEADERSPSEAEREQIARMRTELEELEPQIIEQIELEETRAKARDASAILERGKSPGAGTGAPAGTGGAIVRQAGLGVHRTPGEFIVDHLRAKGGMRNDNGLQIPPDAAALERMAPWVQRAIVNQTTADTPGLLPEPIIGEVIGQKTAVQPFITSIGGAKPMGGIPGKTFSRPRITQHTLVGLQNGEKTELPSRQLKVDSIPFDKKTKGGAVDISRQDIDWTVPSAWDILLADLAAVYGEDVEDEAVAAFVDAITAAPVVVAENTLEAWTAALYQAAANVFTSTTPRRLPDRLWMSVDVWAQMGPIVDVALIKAGSMVADLLTSQGIAGLSGNVLAVPRVVVPGAPAGTCVLGIGAAFEVYEEVIGVLTAVEPKLLGVEVAYGGYVAWGAVEPEGLVPITPPAAEPPAGG